MSDLTDNFHPSSAKRYQYYLNALDAGDVYNALVGYGMLGNKVPPALTTENFLSYFKNNQISHPKKNWCRWISFRYMRNTGAYRYFGIPNPFAYEKLSRCIEDNWDDIRKALISNSSSQPYTVNRVHLRKLHKSKAIFEMSYSNWRVDYNPIPALFVGKRYVVHSDVSQCLPTIYTHAVDWAIRDKASAKKDINNSSGNWSGQLDKVLRSTTNGETHGVLIGPHASNIISELLLTPVDKALFGAGFRFERAIDDYACYVETYDKAEQFIIKLETELQKYGLTLNQKKTKIQSLPQATADSWVTALKSYRFANDPLNFKDVSNFLNLTIGLMEKPENDWRVLLYALKTTGKKAMTGNASNYYCSMVLHLTYIYPYLMPHFEDMLGPQNIRLIGSKMGSFFRAAFSDGLHRRDYLTATFSLYYAMHFDKDFGDLVNKPSSIVTCDDCLLKLFALLYARKYGYQTLSNSLVNNAQDLARNTDDFNENWLFCYEALTKSDLDNFIPQENCYKDSWKAIKKAKISFIDNSQL